MSRHISTVPLSAVNKAFGTDITKDPRVPRSQRLKLVRELEAAMVEVNGKMVQQEVFVQVAHGYDRPCYCYFCDLEPECTCGIYYGHIGLTKQLDRWAYRDAMVVMGLKDAVEAVELDLPY